MQAVAPAPVFVVPEPLPRGPHRLSRAKVSESQRSRLMAAIADVVAERGYPGATIVEISARAGVSPKTFYEHFADKLDCYLAGYDRLVEVLYERMGYELAPTTDWHEFIVTALA